MKLATVVFFVQIVHIIVKATSISGKCFIIVNSSSVFDLNQIRPANQFKYLYSFN